MRRSPTAPASLHATASHARAGRRQDMLRAPCEGLATRRATRGTRGGDDGGRTRAGREAGHGADARRGRDLRRCLPAGRRRPGAGHRQPHALRQGGVRGDARDPGAAEARRGRLRRARHRHPRALLLAGRVPPVRRRGRRTATTPSSGSPRRTTATATSVSSAPPTSAPPRCSPRASAPPALRCGDLDSSPPATTSTTGRTTAARSSSASAPRGASAWPRRSCCAQTTASRPSTPRG